MNCIAVNVALALQVIVRSRYSQPKKNMTPSARKTQALRAVEPCRAASASHSLLCPFTKVVAPRSNAPVSSSLTRVALRAL